MLIALFIFILLVIGIFLASFTIRFNWRGDARWAALSYIFANVRLDFGENTGQIKLGPIKLKSFKLEKPEKKPKKAKPPKEKPEKKGKKRFSLDDIRLEYLKALKVIAGNITVHRLQIDVNGGFSEPFYTGKMYGYYWVLKGMFPNLMSHVNFRPDFSNGNLKIEADGDIRLRMIHIVRAGIMLGYYFISPRIKKKFIIKNRRAGYVQ